MFEPAIRWGEIARGGQSAYFPAALVGIAILIGAVYADIDNARDFNNSLHFSVAERLSAIRSRLESNIHGSIQLIEGLAAAISQDPDLTQDKFAALAEPLVTGRSLVHNIDFAPDMVIRLMYPLEGNEKAIGLDFRTVPGQREAAERTKESGALVLNGPIELVQGGEGLVGRIRVMRESGPKDQKTFWGLLSAVIHTERLYQASGLLEAGLPIEIAIRGRDGLGDQGAVFFGRAAVFDAAPVLAEVTLPFGTWQMAAIPKGGWPLRPSNAWPLRLTFLLGGILIVIPVGGIGWLLDRRRKDIEMLRWHREMQLLAVEAASGFLVTTKPDEAFSRLLDGIIGITKSEFGFLGYVLVDAAGKDYLHTRAITDIAWNDETRALLAGQGRNLDLCNLDTLFGHTLRTGEAVIANHPRTDPRAGGLPHGHPVLNSYLGVPLNFEGRMVGMVGIANRPGGYDQHLVAGMAVVWAAAASMLYAAKIEEERKRSDERVRILSKAIEASPSLVPITDQAGCIQYANPQFCAVTGYAPDEVLGKMPNILKSSETAAESYVEMWRTITAGRIWRSEIRNRRKDGSYYDAEIAIAPIVNESGTITHFVNVQEDITEKRRALAALAENERRFREMVEVAGDAFHFYSLTPDGRYLYASPNCRMWFGIDRDGIWGRNWVDVADWSPGSIARMTATIHQYLDGAAPTQVAMTYTRDGEARHLVSYPHLVRDDHGRFIKLEGVAVDVTERLRLETKLRLAVDAAERANRAKSEFLSNMSHELRTPLNAVIGFAQLLDYNPKEPLTQAQKKCVEHILKGGQHLLELISEILDLAKIESGRVDLSIEDNDLSALLDECRSFVLPFAQRQGIAVRVMPCPGVMVRADYTRLKQVLLNLLSNAVKYNRPGGSIQVCWETPDAGGVAITVADTGIGIPEDKRQDLFRPFSRLGQENSGIEGTGIGLTITKCLMDMMGGSIEVDSAVGRGSTFRVVLPSGPAGEPAVKEVAVVNRTVPDGIRGTVIYVEDNPANIELMAMVFSRLDHLELLTAPSGELGIDLVRANRPDLIILDLNLPGMDGFEILKRLRHMEEAQGIPIFALTASATKRDIERGYQAGFDKYLTKPFAVDVLVASVREVVKAPPRR